MCVCLCSGRHRFQWIPLEWWPLNVRNGFCDCCADYLCYIFIAHTLDVIYLLLLQIIWVGAWVKEKACLPLLTISFLDYDKVINLFHFILCVCVYFFRSSLNFRFSGCWMLSFGLVCRWLSTCMRKCSGVTASVGFACTTVKMHRHAYHAVFGWSKSFSLPPSYLVDLRNALSCTIFKLTLAFALYLCVCCSPFFVPFNITGICVCMSTARS